MSIKKNPRYLELSRINVEDEIINLICQIDRLWMVSLYFGVSSEQLGYEVFEHLPITASLTVRVLDLHAAHVRHARCGSRVGERLEHVAHERHRRHVRLERDLRRDTSTSTCLGTEITVVYPGELYSSLACEHRSASTRRVRWRSRRAPGAPGERPRGGSASRARALLSASCARAPPACGLESANSPAQRPCNVVHPEVKYKI